MRNLHRLSTQLGARASAGRTVACAIAVALIAGACATGYGGNGSGPTVAVMPGGGKGMPEFNKDDIACRDTARVQAKDNSSPPPVAMGFVKGEVVASRGSRLSLRQDKEAATGSVFGGSTAADPNAPFTVQQRYDTAYVQCMYSKGHKIPVNEAMSS